MTNRTLIAAFSAIFALGVAIPAMARADDGFSAPVSSRELGAVNGKGQGNVALVLDEPGLLSEPLPEALSDNPGIIPSDAYTAGQPYPSVFPTEAAEALASVGPATAGVVNAVVGDEGIIGGLFGGGSN